MPQGVPESIPDDGLTTRQRRNQPILAVNTGAGKGKSTAAFGMAMRAWNAGLSVAVFQFVKSAKWKVGEENGMLALGRMHEMSAGAGSGASGPQAGGAGSGAGGPRVGGPVEWHKMGQGWSWIRSNAETEQDHAESARAGWAEIARRLGEQTHDFYVLDEFTYPLHWGWIDTGEVVETLRARPGKQHVIITGRYAPEELIAAADLVTEMTKIKHPMDAGRKGQKGIEW